MSPAFGLVEAKALLPYFMDAVTKACGLRLCSILEPNLSPCRQMADKWSGIIENGESGYSAVIDVNLWVGKAALDAYVVVLALGGRELRIDRRLTSQRIGAGAFGYDFGALDDADNPFTKSYTNLTYDRLPSSTIKGSNCADHPSYLLVLPPSGTSPNYAFSSWPS